jgi:HEAT repeat protein
MAARSVDEQVARLEALRHAPASAPEVVAEIRKGLASKHNLPAAKAAGLAGAKKLREVEGALVDAFKRFLGPGTDKGCLAKTAIVKALVAIDTCDDAVYLIGSRHVQPEPTWGGSSDVAVELRCESVMALVRMNSRRMWDPLVRLLADADANARAIAARSLGATGQDVARWLLEFKILTGDREPAVTGECFGAWLAVTRSVELIVPFLNSHDDALREAAALALGESRLPEAFTALRAAHAGDVRRDSDFARLLALAVAMTRQPDAIEYLVQVLAEGRQNAEDVLEALAMYRGDATVRAKVEGAITGAPANTRRAFEKHFR